MAHIKLILAWKHKLRITLLRVKQGAPHARENYRCCGKIWNFVHSNQKFWSHHYWDPTCTYTYCNLPTILVHSLLRISPPPLLQKSDCIEMLLYMPTHQTKYFTSVRNDISTEHCRRALKPVFSSFVLHFSHVNNGGAIPTSVAITRMFKW